MTTLGLSSPSSASVRPGLRAASLPAFAGALSLSAAIAHLGVITPHWRMWWAHGLFFVVCGVVQALFAVLVVWRPRPWLALAGIAGNLTVISMYVYSRTNGLPAGPHEGVPEEPGVYDMTTTAGEFVLVVVLVLMLGGRARTWAMRMVLLAAAGLWTAKATGVLV